MNRRYRIGQDSLDSMRSMEYPLNYILDNFVRIIGPVQAAGRTMCARLAPPEHRAQAVRIGLNVGNENDAGGIMEPRQKTIGSAEADRAGFADASR